jgi:hypothetical protein
MDRKIIVLTPSEWDNRVQLFEFAQKSHDHNHFNKDAQLGIKSITWLAVNHIKNGEIDEALKELEKIPEICERIYKDSCRAQDGIGDLAALIKYKLKPSHETILI